MARGKTKRIFVLQPFSREFTDIYESIVVPAAFSAGVEVFRVDQITGAGSIVEEIYNAIEQTELLICDISNSHPNVMYELGFAHALMKPVIMISQEPENAPFDVKGTRILYYGISSLSQYAETIRELQRLIEQALKNPLEFSARPVTQRNENNVFISYSRHDIQYLKRLLVHLKPLEKKGIIDLWVDTKLAAGDRWKEEIEKALKQARVAILLVSADFLASDFIVDNELPPLLSKAESEGTRVIPVILRPCRFTRDENLKRFQAINDPGKPISNVPDFQQEVIYDSISELVEKSIVR